MALRKGMSLQDEMTRRGTSRPGDTGSPVPTAGPPLGAPTAPQPQAPTGGAMVGALGASGRPAGKPGLNTMRQVTAQQNAMIQAQQQEQMAKQPLPQPQHQIQPRGPPRSKGLRGKGLRVEAMPEASVPAAPTPPQAQAQGGPPPQQQPMLPMPTQLPGTGQVRSQTPPVSLSQSHPTVPMAMTGRPPPTGVGLQQTLQPSSQTQLQTTLPPQPNPHLQMQASARGVPRPPLTGALHPRSTASIPNSPSGTGTGSLGSLPTSLGSPPQQPRGPGGAPFVPNQPPLGSTMPGGVGLGGVGVGSSPPPSSSLPQRPPPHHLAQGHPSPTISATQKLAGSRQPQAGPIGPAARAAAAAAAADPRNDRNFNVALIHQGTQHMSNMPQGHPVTTPIKSPLGSNAAVQLHRLMEEVDSGYTVDNRAKELLLMMADDFVNKLMAYAVLMAKHRKAEAIDVCDIQISLEKHWGLKLPGEILPGKALIEHALPPVAPEKGLSRGGLKQKKMLGGKKSASKKRRANPAAGQMNAAKRTKK